MPAHHLADQHAVVRLRGRVQTVDRVDGDLDGRVETEGHLGARQIVVDRLRHADDADPAVGQLQRHAERVFPPDRDQGVDLEPRDRRLDLLRAPFDLERIGARRAENRSAPRQQTARALGGERESLSLDQSPVSVRETRELVAVRFLAFPNNGPNHGIQPGRVSASRENSHPHGAHLRGSCPRTRL